MVLLASGAMEAGALYEGRVFHTRGAAGPSSTFSRRVAMPLVDLSGLAGVQVAPLFFRHSPVRFHRSDFLGDPARSLAEAVRDEVEAASGDRPSGAVLLLGLQRSWGVLFNPISCYFCFDDRSDLVAMVAEVSNTPWHERHAYVVGPPGEYLLEKALHVSPFMEMALTYRITYEAPGETFALRIEVLRGEERLLDTAFVARRREFGRWGGLRLLVGYPALTLRVPVSIYWRAAVLAARRATRYAHPDRTMRGPRQLLRARRAARRRRVAGSLLKGASR